MEASKNTQHKLKKSFVENIVNYFREYCMVTSIHGFRYIGENRTIFERIWWFLIFAICFCACTATIYSVYEKWERSPVIVSFATKGTPIYHIPFPSITVCPESKSIPTIFNYTEILRKKEDGIRLTKADINETFSDEFFDVIDAVKPQFNIEGCSYMGKSEDCNQLFTPIITDEGVCYTFNMLDRSDMFQEGVIHYKDYHRVHHKASHWTLEYGYTENAGIETYPRRALVSGAASGFTFNIITFKADLDYACKNSLQGSKVVLHTPMQLPRPSQQYFRVPLDQNVVGAVNPVMITTSDSVKTYNPSRRQCYFPTEKHLKFFKIYTTFNCLMECLTNYTLGICGCVNFFMPRENGTKICGTALVDCMRDAESAMQMNYLYEKLNKQKNLQVDCDCLPICADLSYDIEMSQVDWEWEKQKRADRRNHKNYTSNKVHLSSLTIFFKFNSFIRSQRHELYGPTDFLANFGGLLGLFTGFSVVSLIEILYFLSVRIICNVRIYGHWAGITNKICDAK